MSFLLDTDHLSAHLRRPSGLAHRVFQYSGRLYTPSITLAELYVWAYRRPDPTPALESIERMLLHDLSVVDYDDDCAKEFAPGAHGTAPKWHRGSNRRFTDRFSGPRLRFDDGDAQHGAFSEYSRPAARRLADTVARRAPTSVGNLTEPRIKPLLLLSGGGTLECTSATGPAAARSGYRPRQNQKGAVRRYHGFRVVATLRLRQKPPSPLFQAFVHDLFRVAPRQPQHVTPRHVGQEFFQVGKTGPRQLFGQCLGSNPQAKIETHRATFEISFDLRTGRGREFESQLKPAPYGPVEQLGMIGGGHDDDVAGREPRQDWSFHSPVHRPRGRDGAAPRREASQPNARCQR